MRTRFSNRPPLSRFRNVVYAATAFLILALIVTVPIAFTYGNFSWAASLVIFFLTLALCTLNLRSEFAVKVFEYLKLDLLVPSLRHVIDHHKQLEQCRTTLKKMEYTLSFYNLWVLLKPDDEVAQQKPPAQKQSPRERIAAWWDKLRERLRWKGIQDLLNRDPDTRTPALPDEITYTMIDFDRQEDRITSCTEGTAKYLKRHIAQAAGLPATAPDLKDYTILADEAGETLKGLDAPTWGLLLELLYREQHGLPTIMLWEKIRQNTYLVYGLVAILLWSQRLPRPLDDLPYEINRLKELAHNLEFFSLEQTRSAVADDQKLRYENRSLVEKIEYTVDFFNLGPVERAFWGNLPDTLNGGPIERRRKDCAQKVATRLSPQSPFVSDDLLELLYLERHGPAQEAKQLWHEKKHDLRFMTGLAEALLNSKQLPSVEEDLPLTADGLTELVKPLDAFTLDDVRVVVLADQERRRANRHIVEGMRSALDHYNLYPLLDNDATETLNGRLTLTTKLRRALIDAADAPPDDRQRITYYADRIAECIQASKLTECVRNKVATGELPGEDVEVIAYLQSTEPHVWGTLMRLFFLEDHEQPLSSLWKNCRQDKAVILPLASLLVCGRLLPREDKHLPYGIGDVTRVLPALPTFSPTQVRTELDGLNIIWQRAVRYMAFLEKNDLTAWKPHVGTMLDEIELPVSCHSLDSQVQHVLVWIGQNAIREKYATLPDAIIDETKVSLQTITTDTSSEFGERLVDGLSLVFLIIFITEDLTENLSLREPVCRIAAGQDKAPFIVFGYLELREYLRSENVIGGREFVSMDYLALNWINQVQVKQERQGRGFWEEIKAIRSVLSEGDWLRRLPAMLGRTYEDILKENSALNQKLGRLLRRRPEIRKLLEVVFRGLKAPTVERYLESRTRIAYLLHFRVARGTLAYLLDCLISDDKRSILHKIGIQPDVKDLPEGKLQIQQKYNFRHYTPSTRIGVIPTKWTFDQFCGTLQQDLFMLYQARDQLLPPSRRSQRDLDDIEVIVSRFGLAGQNYQGIEIGDLTQPRAITRISELLSEILGGKELSAVINYEEENMAQVIIDLPIKELLVACNVKSNEVERTVLEREDQRLKQELVSGMGCIDIQELARSLYISPANKHRAKAILIRQMAGEPELNVKRRRRFADAYIDTLAALGTLLP